MLLRHPNMSFGGAYTFPGGKLEQEDSDPRLLRILGVSEERVYGTVFS